MSLSVPFSALVAVLAVSAAHATVLPAPVAPITRVTLYAGAAAVERSQALPAGARSATFDCLPATLDVKSLQVDGGADLQVGALDVRTVPRALAPQCDVHPLDARIQALETARDAAQAETEALGLATGYLKRWGEDTGPAAAGPARRIVEVSDTLRRTGQDALQQQRMLARRIAELDRQLEPLLAERTRSRGARGERVTSVLVTVNGATASDLRLRYLVTGATWAPAYRTALDTGTGRVSLERQALVTQATGEDWRGVALRLSTGQPKRAAAGPVPLPWRVDVARPVTLYGQADQGLPVAAASAPVMPGRDEGRSAVRFEAVRIDTPFDTTFEVPQRLDVTSGAEGVSVTLGRHEAGARLVSRVSPQQEAAAYLVADFAVPDGVWPSGPMQLYRDGTYVGDTRFDVARVERLALPFGRDDLVRVAADPERDTRGTGGFTGGRTERTVRHGYTIENRHAAAIAVEVLEASPVAVDDRVRVTTTFTPQPVERDWQRHPGVARWAFDLAPGATTRVAATYVIAHPKELAVTGP